jgi:hypothetical protein
LEALSVLRILHEALVLSNVCGTTVFVMKLTDWYYKAAAEAHKLGTSRSVVFPCKLEVRKANMAERRTDLPSVSSSRSEISKLTVRPSMYPAAMLSSCPDVLGRDIRYRHHESSHLLISRTKSPPQIQRLISNLIKRPFGFII